MELCARSGMSGLLGAVTSICFVLGAIAGNHDLRFGDSLRFSGPFKAERVRLAVGTAT